MKNSSIERIKNPYNTLRRVYKTRHMYSLTGLLYSKEVESHCDLRLHTKKI